MVGSAIVTVGLCANVHYTRTQIEAVAGWEFTDQKALVFVWKSRSAVPVSQRHCGLAR